VTREGAKTVEALIQKTCVPCSGDLPPITEIEIAELLILTETDLLVRE
jgi:4a-hydroxytetrahydrobiopterin dehydratase